MSEINVHKGNKGCYISYFVANLCRTKKDRKSNRKSFPSLIPYLSSIF